MQLTDMKSTVPAKESTALVPTERDEYPYGLCISLDEGSLEKLGISMLPAVGADVKLVAIACVVTVSQHECQGDEKPNRCVSLQIEKLAVLPSKGDDSKDDKAGGMYPTMLG